MQLVNDASNRRAKPKTFNQLILIFVPLTTLFMIGMFLDKVNVTKYTPVLEQPQPKVSNSDENIHSQIATNVPLLYSQGSAPLSKK